MIPRFLLIGAIVAVLAAAPWWADRGTIRLLVEALTLLALAQLWNLLAGYAGLISVGQQAFVGLGGYLLFSLAMFAGVPVLWALPLVGMLCALIALPVGALAFRLTGPYFAIGTWVIAEVFRLGFAQVGSLGGGSGISLPVGLVREIADGRGAREALIYWLALGLAVGVTLSVWAALRARTGLMLGAVRDDAEAAAALGVRVLRVKFGVYVAVAGATGLVGALAFLQRLRITPEAAFSVTDWSVVVIFVVVIGGIGALEGPILGVVLFFALREVLSDLGSWYLVILGITSIAVMLVEPKGLWGLLTRHREVRLFPISAPLPRSLR
ncbi:branched-chain amino acid ABC transporter permease [Jannaschia sp. 2305UL9-9]|uniref:branched-chain amino acid ABC transporter permease n=1 Tax=Jannaschia sp. 2305UL9-9 TaxID=3121638 RepID=UPI00352845E4